MCKTFKSEVEAAWLEACFEIHIAWHRSFPYLDNIPEFIDEYDYDNDDVIPDGYYDDLIRYGKL